MANTSTGVCLHTMTTYDYISCSHPALSLSYIKDTALVAVVAHRQTTVNINKRSYLYQTVGRGIVIENLCELQL